MSRSSSSKASKTNWPRIKAMNDKDIRLTAEHPIAGMKHIVRGIARRGLQPVPPKASISLRVDADGLDWILPTLVVIGGISLVGFSVSLASGSSIRRIPGND